ncbi:MAG: hypothetical protein ACXW2P_06810 [Thermoanaerobaculia bacterium]
MKVIREQAEARWLPSRHRSAIFRLAAYARFRASPKRRQPGLALGIDRDQSAAESYTVAVWVMASATCFLFALIDRVLVTPAAAILAPVAAAAALQVFMVAPGLVKSWRQRDNTAINSFITMLAMTVTAIYLTQDDRWVRVVAWSFLACLAANAVAWIVTRFMAGRFAAAENEVVAS